MRSLWKEIRKIMLIGILVITLMASVNEDDPIVASTEEDFQRAVAGGGRVRYVRDRDNVIVETFPRRPGRVNRMRGSWGALDMSSDTAMF